MSKNRTSYFDRFLLVRLSLIAMIAFGAFLVYFQSMAYIRAHQSVSWPRTTGVLSVEVGRSRKTLSYQYTVDSVTYTADRVIFGELGDRVRCKEWTAVSNTPSGSELVVYYCPDDPMESTLHTKLLEGSWLNLLLGSVFFLGGSFTMIALLRLNRIAESGPGE